MDTYQRLYKLSQNLKNERQSLLDGLLISTPPDYAGMRFILGKVQKLDDILKDINLILKD